MIWIGAHTIWSDHTKAMAQQCVVRQCDALTQAPSNAGNARLANRAQLLPAPVWVSNVYNLFGSIFYQINHI